MTQTNVELTPMLRQYFDLKAKADGAVLLFRMGDFYEIFDKDAEEVAPRLGITLTSREKGKESGERMPFCGVPHHSARSYWLKLLRLGYKVAIAEQTEDPAAAKGLVQRAIVRILTPGCVDELDALEDSTPNYLPASSKTQRRATGPLLLSTCPRASSGWVTRPQPSSLG